MNEQLPNGTNPEDEKTLQLLSQVAEQTNVNAQFATKLEERLRAARRAKSSSLAASFRQISPVLRWAALMLLLAAALSWSIRTLIPAPQPASENTPAATDGTIFTSTPALPVDETATLITPESGFDFRGAKLSLEASLPTSPTKAHVYLLKKDEPATEEQARAFAERFGIQGEMYTAPNYVFNTTDYVISDGKQSLQVYSQRYFSYTADMSKTIKISTNTPHANAEATIREFLQARGFAFEFSIHPSNAFDGYIVRLLAPDSIPMQYESFTYPAMRVTLDETGEVLIVDATLMEYDSAPLGEYEIITAQEAFDRVLDDYAVTGKMEWGNSPDQAMRDWFRTYPDNQPVTAYGYITKFHAAHSDTPPLVLFDGVPVTGNTSGLESLEHYTFVKATGQYLIENGVRKFSVESWDRSVQEMPFAGTLSRQGNQIILTSTDGSGQQYALIDPPVDPPLDVKAPDSLEVYGVLENDKLSWVFMRFFENVGSGGGGGGNGLGFYKLNLSGAPVPFPSPTARPQSNSGTIGYIVQENDTLASIALNHGISVDELMQANDITENQVVTGETLVIPVSPTPVFFGLYTVKEGDTLIGIAQNLGTTVEELMRINNLTDSSIYIGRQLSVPIPEPAEQRVDDLRGYLSISIHTKADGTSTKEYILDVMNENGSRLYIMEGSLPSELDSYNALPILVSGTIDSLGNLAVENYKIPYPNLQFQIVKGTQSIAQLEGQNVIILTTDDGKSYVEYLATNQFPLTAESITGQLGDILQQEVLIIPDESFGGMPVAHVFQSAIVQENGPTMEIQSNKILTYSDSDDPSLTDYLPPNLTITDVELVYYVSNPYYQVNDSNYSQRSPYIQPAWHFRGRYDDGSEFDVLIQALKQEFLLPELAPYTGVG
jgi:LysM repeat protein